MASATHSVTTLRFIRVMVVGGSFFAAIAPTFAAAQSDVVASFEVVSIRPSPPGTRWSYQDSRDEMELTGASARVLIADAYGFDVPNIVGGPAWIDSTPYDVKAKFNESVGERLALLSPKDRMNQILIMLRLVMEERFRLKVHHETREKKVFNLVVAKGGPKFSPAAASGGVADQHEVQASYNGHRWTVNREPMSFLALQLSRIPDIGRNVIDQTGLKGEYKFTFDWSVKTDPDVSVFTALEEQLGLRLEPAKGAIDVLVVDQVEPPSEN